MFPDLPHPGHSWRLTHHMGPVTADHLYHILWAANAFARNRDPAADINVYLNSNEQWTANVRTDSGQPDGWRDYQQVLSELSLIYSVEVMNPITLTTLGLALLDGSLGFSEVMTLQASAISVSEWSSYCDKRHASRGVGRHTLRCCTDFYRIAGCVWRSGCGLLYWYGES